MARKSSQKPRAVNMYRMILVHPLETGRLEIKTEMNQARLADGHNFTLLPDFRRQHRVYLAQDQSPQLVIIPDLSPQVSASRTAVMIKKKNPHAFVVAVRFNTCRTRKRAKVDGFIGQAELFKLLRPMVYAFHNHPSIEEMQRFLSEVRNPKP